MTADKKIVSIVDRSVARIVREYYSDPDKGVAVLHRYHPGVTKKEIRAALHDVDEPPIPSVSARGLVSRPCCTRGARHSPIIRTCI
jgi:hypothetical protein